ncbi:hypothetical protein U1Q18_003708 [Sarracenia purpurea var. burkii]
MRPQNQDQTTSQTTQNISTILNRRETYLNNGMPEIPSPTNPSQALTVTDSGACGGYPVAIAVSFEEFLREGSTSRISPERRPNAALFLEDIKQEVENYDADHLEGTPGKTLSASRQAHLLPVMEYKKRILGLIQSLDLEGIC